jgi:hypothetical protein
MAQTDVALWRNVDALVPNIVEVELAPKDSLNPPPRPDCSSIVSTRTIQAMIWIVIKNIYIVSPHL